MKIQVRQASEADLKKLGVKSWPIWECSPSTFEYHYDEQEMCYVLEGKVTVKAKGQTVDFGPGDLVIFPKGLDCVWTVHEAVRKHYKF